MSLEKTIHTLLSQIGENPERDGLEETPRRVAKAMKFFTKGYEEDAGAMLKKAIFHTECSEMVIVKDVDFYSLCEHHMVPFYGRCHVAYIPKDGRIVGLSKIARVVEVFSRRLQVQERLTREIAETLQSELKPMGVGVVMEARHLCMMMRGVEKQHSSTVTSAMLGTFRDLQATRGEFLSLIKPSIGNL